MAKMTRRTMVWATSAGVATLSGAAAVLTALKPGNKASAAGTQTSASAETSTGAVTAGALTLYVRDVAKSEISLFVGEREIVVQDAALVNQLLSKVR